MTFAAINYLSISINLLLVVFVFVCVLMTLVILMQRPKQEGLGAAFGAGVTDQVFGARTTGVLQKATIYLGSAFFILSLALAILIGQQNKQKTLVTKSVPAKTQTVTPAVPEAPKSLSEELPAPAPAPVTPATPEVEVPVPATPAPAPETPAAPAPAPGATAPAPAAPAPATPAPGAPSEKTEGQ
jgi:preprotein translocase subunit SecG